MKLAFAALLLAASAQAQDSQQLIATMVQHEAEANTHRGRYVYTSEERSERTGGHQWTERVAETAWGKVRYLVLEDGEPLTSERLADEKGKLADEAVHPDEFKKEQAARADDEQHAKQMLTMLPKAFLFDAPVDEGQFFRIQYRPRPDYAPQGLEEKVLHGMSGLVVVEKKNLRLREIEGKLPLDLSLGFGLLATIHAGSSFSTTREPLDPPDWKTETVHSDIRGKALFLKTVAREGEARHSAFKRIPDQTTVAEAVTLVEQPAP